MTSATRRIRSLLAILAAIGLVGMAASAALAADPSWTSWTVSQLTSDSGAGTVFRLTMGGPGVVMCLIVVPVRVVVAVLRGADLASGGAALIPFCLAVAGIGFLGVAAFPLDQGPYIEIAHGVAAYAIPIAVLILMLGARLMVPTFGRASLFAIGLILVLYLVAVVGLVGYAVMELVAFTIAGAWLAWLLVRLAILAGGVTTRAPT